jgi:Flp pilus assembly protein TadG
VVRSRRHRESQRGAVAVEFALVLPILLLLVLGGIDWGYYFFASQIVSNAAREGARTGSLKTTGTPCDEATGAIAVAKDYLVRARLLKDPSDDRAVIACTRSTVVDPNDAVLVKIVYQAKPGSMSLTGYLPAGLLPTSATAVATMRLEP